MDHNKKGWSWPGNWKVVCDVCSMQYPSSRIKKRWDGLMVCEKDWETRHPQTLYKYRPHTSVPEFIRKEPTEDTFIAFCDVATISGYAGLGTAGCMQAGNNAVPYDVLVDMFTNGHE